jgi:predicted amidohydrolase
MERSIKIAVVQMDAAPATLEEKLDRSGKFVALCAEKGAGLVVLPELFNTGYEYSDRNYQQAESFDGPTSLWIRTTAAQYGLHLAGSFLRREGGQIFNTCLLVAPDGQEWSYDKNYPWMWERAYFQKGINITVADTKLGKIGLLLCWDVAHLNLWRQYAGKVQLMIVCSCPPRALDLTLELPDGQQIMGKTGALIKYMKSTSDNTFGEYLRRQAAFLRVPVAQSTSTGMFRSSLPVSKLSLTLLSAVYPPLWKHRSQSGPVQIHTEYFNETFIADSRGTVTQAVRPGAEGYALSDVCLPDSPPATDGIQPSFGIPSFTYLFDYLANVIFAAEYKRKIRQYV